MTLANNTLQGIMPYSWHGLSSWSSRADQPSLGTRLLCKKYAIVCDMLNGISRMPFVHLH